MIRHQHFAVTAALACLVFLNAPGAWAQGKFPLRRIKIEGNKLHTDQQLLAVTGLKVGQAADKAIFDAARDRLLRTGVLETVAYHYGPSGDGSGYSVTFKVAEAVEVVPFEFENVDAPEKDLRAWLKQKDPLYIGKIAGSKEAIRRYARLIEEFLKQRGAPEPIRGEMTASGPTDYYVMFHPKGAMPVVAEVDFEGNKVVPTDMLRTAIHGVAVGTRYSRGNFQMLLNSGIRPVYEARGRIDVSFPGVKVERARGEVNGVRVIVKIDEGASYSFGVVRIEGTASLDQSLYDAIEVKPGGVANMTYLEDGIEQIKKALAEKAYMAAEVTVAKRIDKEKKVVDVLYRVKPGPQYAFGKLLLEGLDINGEFEIKRIWGLAHGEPFDPSYADFFLERVKELGLFDNLKKTAVEYKTHDNDRTVDIILVFNPKERKMRFGESEEEIQRRESGRKRRP